MDNFHIDVTSMGEPAFRAALGLCRWPKVTGYRIGPGARIVLYWTSSSAKDYVALPYWMTLDQAATFVLGWLEQVDYCKEPDHDGSNSKGWRMYCEDWGHVDSDPYAFIAIEPTWAMHGK